MKCGTLRIIDGKFVVAAPPHVSIRLRRTFGGVQRYKAGVFTLAATAEHAYDLEWFRQRHPLEIAADSAERYAQLLAQHERRLASIAEIDRDGYVPREFELAIPARDYQRVAADLLIRTRSLLVADELGTGKTVTAICALTAPGMLPALVVTMTHLTRQWEVMLARFAPKLRVHRVRSGKPYDFAEIKVERDPLTKRRRVVRAKGMPDVIVMNYHKMHNWVESLAGDVRAAIFDEAQELRHSGTRKHDAALALAEAVDVRCGLSATPIYNYGIEIYNVMRVIAPEQLGSAREFTDEWCDGNDDGKRVADGKIAVTDPAALGTYLRESGLMIRRTRKDVGREIPALTVVRHVVEADPESIERATADIAELARRVLDRIGTPLEQMQAAGEIDYRLRQATGIAKAGAVAEFVRLLVDAGEQVVLFGWHHEVYRLWQGAFERGANPVPCALYTGQQSDAQKDEARRRFVSGEAKVLIISLRSGAGLDGLQHVCRTVVIGELDWSPQVIHQDIGRVHRDGQAEPVMAYVVVAEEGSDPVIADVLGIKEAQSALMLDPDGEDKPVAAGAAADHIRRLAEDVLKRRQAA